ncbi:MAG TPA: hypothetical protein VIN67_05500 [Desulfobaccales bacterium]
MRLVFGFFLRLFFCFVGAKVLVRAISLDTRAYLLTLTAVFLINVYLFQYLVFRDRSARDTRLGAAPEKAPGEPSAPDNP